MALCSASFHQASTLDHLVGTVAPGHDGATHYDIAPNRVTGAPLLAAAGWPADVAG
jgi:hypothetical protein